MAVTTVVADHLDPAKVARPTPNMNHGKLRVIVANLTQGAAAGDIGSQWTIARLPPGPVTVIPHLCRYRVDALGASRTMNIGLGAYVKRGDQAGTQEAIANNVFANAIDVSGATAASFPVTGGMEWHVWSVDGVDVIAVVNGGTIPASATGEFIIVYSDVN